ncbi:MAG: OmpH family outer membrane protein [Pseudomonadota bacterium]|nr:OmpH family outer membrane protein [Pseudomonadota bacterium]|tara:strand:+ start:2306 stop:2818 length:513 start_codon:yes stop_codon:yes gene_type:complete
MEKIRLSILIFAMFISFNVFGLDLKIAYVDIATIVNEAPAAKAAQKKLEQEFAPRNAKLKASSEKLRKQKEKYKKEAEVLSEDQLKALQKKILKLERALERDTKEAREDFQIRRNEELGKIEKKLKKVILKIAKQDKYDLIFTNADVTYASPDSKIDITARVLKSLNKSK